MPKVGKKTFGYGSEGKKAASKYAKKHGLKVSKKSNPGYYAEGTIASRINRVLFSLSEEGGGKKKGGKPARRRAQRPNEPYELYMRRTARTQGEADSWKSGGRRVSPVPSQERDTREHRRDVEGRK